MTTATETRRAIGFLQVEISGSRLDQNRVDIANYADAAHLKIVKSMRVRPTSIDPGMRLIEAMRLLDADLVIVPTLLHVAFIKRDITAIGEIRALTGEIWEQGFEWPTMPAPFPIARGLVYGA